MLVNIINNLKNENTDAGKIAIIKNNKDNQNFIKLLDIVYNPKTRLGITDFELPSETGNDILDNIISSLDYLQNGIYRGNDAETFIIKLAKQLDYENQLLLQKVIRKNLQADLGIKTINSAIPNFVKKPPYMRCALLNEKTSSKIKYPAYIQEKLDGQFCNVIVTKNNIQFVSRAGTEYKFKRDFSNLQQLIYYTLGECVIMGELLCAENGNIFPREIGNGIINKSSETNQTITEEESNKVILKAWDCIPYSDYLERKCNIPYETRFNNVRKITETPNGFIYPVVYNIVNNMEEIMEHYKNLVSQDQEGVIIKNKFATWGDKTSNDQLKLKIKFQVDLRIKGYQCGKSGTSCENTLGALVCESDEGLLEVCVGTGFKESDRDFFWNNDMIGKIVTVEAHRAMEKNGKYSLILPVFIELRHDKDEADSIEKILEQEKSAKYK
ncbi:putative DNA ligase [Campylobacter phage F336]|uniref:DNA ligase n=1 Tax=Campylobacter phage F336 TaxID=2794361 RepID=A0A7T3KDI8_9CAUD|nr:putative DNA ligase [Campylobacter phage F336]